MKTPRETSRFEKDFCNNDKHANWILTANIGAVRLSAVCVTEEHREKTLKHWRKMKAQNIQINERENAPQLLTWNVTIPTNHKGDIRLTLSASTEDSARTQLGNMKYAKWQVWQAKIEQVQPVAVSLFSEEQKPAKEEIAPITVETEVQPVKEETPASHYKTAKQFVSRMRKAFLNKRNYIKDLDAGDLERRLTIIQERVERNTRKDIHGDNAIPRAYDPAAYGLLWTVRRETINGVTYNALKAMTTIELCQLIHTMLVECGENAGDYAQWLMNRFSSKQDQQEAINQPDMSPIEVTQESNHNDKNCMHKTLDTKINLEYNIDNTEKPLTTSEEIAMNQIMTQPEIQLSGEQAALLKIMEETRQHMFITGRAGAGKSVLLREFRQTTKKKIVVAAPTGIAALNVRGQTLHSLFKLPPQLYRKGSLTPNPRLYTLLRRIECLVIDEISMVRADILDAIDERLREAHKTDEPFGGIQVIMFGDCYQLPPVVEENLSEYFEHVHGGHFFFNALVWRQADFKVYELTQVFRQKDPVFKDVLNAVRDGSFVDAQLEQLNAQYGQTVPTEGTVTLAPTNNLVTTINQRKLDQLEGKAHRYQATITGEMKRNVFPTEEILYLKKGAQVVMLKNDKDKRWVNGTVGKIEDLGDDYIDVNIKGIVYTIERDTWDEIAYTYDPDTKKPEAKVVSSFSQYPIRLAWALTIHKSQGQTYESVCIDLTTKTFAPGQMYVALSRCTSLEGLYLSRQVKPDYIIVDAKVKNFMSRVETIIIEEPPIVVDATPVIEEAEQVVESLQIQPSEAQIEAAIDIKEAEEELACQGLQAQAEAEEKASAKKGRKAKDDSEKVVKTDTRLDPMIREGLARLMAKLEAEETTDEERARLVPHSTHKVPTISDVVMEALLNLQAFREVNPGLEAAYEEKRGKKK